MILNKKNIQKINPNIEIPLYDINKVNLGILHFGVGNFHRAHQAVYIHNLLQHGYNNLAILGISLRNKTIKEKLSKQDYLYSVCQKSKNEEKIQIINSIKNIIYAPEEPQKVLDCIADNNINYITITITESGYKFDQQSSSLLFDEDIKNDLFKNNHPKTIIGYLSRGLILRSKLINSPITIISCDNLSKNGDILKKLIIEFMSIYNPEKISWIKKNVKFPNTMVDGIVPRLRKENIGYIEKKISLLDKAPILHEPYVEWYIENNNFLKSEFFYKSNIKIVDNVGLYENIKLRFLNASHSAVSYIGLLLGYKFVHEVMEDYDCYKFIYNFMNLEVLPIVKVPKDFDKSKYINLVLQRFNNPHLNDELKRISIDGSYKIKIRLLDTIKDRLSDKNCSYSSFVITCWFKFLFGKDINNNLIEINDPNKKTLLGIINNKNNIDQIIENFLNYKFVFDINKKDKFFLKNNIKTNFNNINNYGLKNSIQNINNSKL